MDNRIKELETCLTCTGKFVPYMKVPTFLIVEILERSPYRNQIKLKKLVLICPLLQLVINCCMPFCHGHVKGRSYMAANSVPGAKVGKKNCTKQIQRVVMFAFPNILWSLITYYG